MIALSPSSVPFNLPVSSLHQPARKTPLFLSRQPIPTLQLLILDTGYTYLRHAIPTQLLTLAAPASEPISRGGHQNHDRAADSGGGTHDGSGVLKTKTELLTAIPVRGGVDGEHGYFLATPAVVEYLAYEVGQHYRCVRLCAAVSAVADSFPA